MPRRERNKVGIAPNGQRIHRQLPFANVSSERKKAIGKLRWMVEEFKVALFAPELKTAFPISPKRLAVKIKEIEGARPGY